MVPSHRPLDLAKIEVLGHRMAYHDGGDGPVCVFLHGNPTSSYLWRNIVRPLEKRFRCIVPDLIGMGASDKLAGGDAARYSFFRHREFVDEFLRAIVPGDPVVLVLHDWGSALGFDWARRYPDRVAGFVYMEALTMPLRWDQWPEQSRPIFEGLRSDAGETMILEKNLFVERILPASILRELDEPEMAAYRLPFASPGEGRRPTLSWPRSIPLNGEPADVAALVADYAAWMSTNDIPKLFINADPGAILIGEQREFCRSWKNQTEITVPGIHFIQEDSPGEIATALADWLATLG